MRYKEAFKYVTFQGRGLAKRYVTITGGVQMGGGIDGLGGWKRACLFVYMHGRKCYVTCTMGSKIRWEKHCAICECP